MLLDEHAFPFHKLHNEKLNAMEWFALNVNQGLTSRQDKFIIRRSVPGQWLISKIIPVHKKGDNLTCQQTHSKLNVRKISSQCGFK